MTDDQSRSFWRGISQFSFWWLALSAFGVFMLYLGLTQAIFLARQRAWPAVTATVVDAVFLEDFDSEGPSSPELNVVSEYRVAKKTYRSSLYTDRFREFGVVPTRFHKGARLVIFYDPADPSPNYS